MCGRKKDIFCSRATLAKTGRVMNLRHLQAHVSHILSYVSGQGPCGLVWWALVCATNGVKPQLHFAAEVWSRCVPNIYIKAGQQKRWSDEATKWCDEALNTALLQFLCQRWTLHRFIASRIRHHCLNALMKQILTNRSNEAMNSIDNFQKKFVFPYFP